MRPPWMKRWMMPALGLVILAIVLGLLQRELRGFNPAQVRESLEVIPAGRVLLAILLTGASYVCLSGYEWLGARHVGVDQPYRRVALSSFLGYSFSQALGFPLLTGAPVRYRLYSSWGVEAGDIARLVAFYTLTFWVGFVTLGGVVFTGLFVSSGPPAVLSPAALGALGVALLVLAVAYLVVSAGSPRTALRRRFGFAVPTTRTALGQMTVGTGEWLASAGVLYVLLPQDSALGFGLVLGIFLLSKLAGFLSTIPQGLGVFETVFLTALPDAAVSGGVLAAVVAFRLVYYVTPLLIAAAILGVIELRRREEAVITAVSAVRSGVYSSVPLVLSGAVFLAGALLLATGALPISGHLAWLGRVPLPVVEASHFLGSIAGASLLILSWGLARRLDGAFHAALALLVLSAGLAIFRGMGLVSVASLVLLASVLLAARREFFRPTTLTREPLSPEWTFGVLGVLGTMVWLGFWAYRDVELSAELWWRFAVTGDGPRFLRGTVGATAVLLLFSVARLFRPPEPEEAEALTDEVRAVIDASSRPSVRLAYLGDKRMLLSKSRRALVMYGVEGRSWVSMGDPVGDPADFEDLIWLLRSRAFRHGGWPVFYQVTPTYLPLYIDAGLGLVKLGEEAIVDVQGFGLEGGSRAGMRKTVRRAEKDGATFEVLSSEMVEREMPRLRAVSDIWLEAKRAREKSFSMGSFSEDYIRRFPASVVRVEGTIVAFANMWLGGDGEEFSLDLMRYDPAAAPDGVMQYLFAQALLWGKERGYTRFSLGMAPLSGLESRPLAPVTTRLGSLVYRHGEHFYNFQGLKAYKEKFDPVWEPRYLACRTGPFTLPRIVGNIATLIGGGVGGILRR